MYRKDKKILDLSNAEKHINLGNSDWINRDQLTVLEKNMTYSEYIEHLKTQKREKVNKVQYRANFNKKSIILKHSEMFILEFFINILSPCETVVTTKAIQGYSNPEIAKILCVAEKTVKFHLTRVFKKLGISNRSQLIWLLPIFNKDIISMKDNFLENVKKVASHEHSKNIKEFLENKDSFVTLENSTNVDNFTTPETEITELSIGIKKVSL